MVLYQNLLMQQNGAHGSAYYMLTGTDDYNFLLDTMEKKKQVDSTGAASLLASSDGYRLRLMMVKMFVPMAANGDIQAICLYSPTMNGALCGGIQHDGTNAKPYGSWVKGGAFVAAADSGIDLP